MGKQRQSRAHEKADADSNSETEFGQPRLYYATLAAAFLVLFVAVGYQFYVEDRNGLLSNVIEVTKDAGDSRASHLEDESTDMSVKFDTTRGQQGVGGANMPKHPRKARKSRSRLKKWTRQNPTRHDAGAFTQGLVLHKGRMIESTGLYGSSTLREVDPATGDMLRSVALEDRLFGEGIVVWEERVLMLTWKENVLLEFDIHTFEEVNRREFHTSTGEGWGMTHDGTQLIVSDGSSNLLFWDPETLQETRRVRVTWRGNEVKFLNELEYVRGEVWANVWYQDLLVRINPRTGKVRGIVELPGLLSDSEKRSADCLNGIAYDGRDGLYITGKNYPWMWKLDLVWG